MQNLCLYFSTFVSTNLQTRLTKAATSRNANLGCKLSKQQCKWQYTQTAAQKRCFSLPLCLSLSLSLIFGCKSELPVAGERACRASIAGRSMFAGILRLATRNSGKQRRTLICWLHYQSRSSYFNFDSATSTILSAPTSTAAPAAASAPTSDPYRFIAF